MQSEGTQISQCFIKSGSMCVCLCVCVCVCKCVCTCGGQRSDLGIFLRRSTLNITFNVLAALTGQRASGAKACIPHLGFYTGPGDLNSGCHTCPASTLPTEPSPQPLGNKL